jgi:Orsellinic acid/F9775 biosynthesis cluster protein D
MSEQYIIYLTTFHVIVCRLCQHGITKHGIRRHFSKRHKELELDVRKKLEKYVETLDVLEPSNVELPTGEINPVKGLMIHEGFICTVGECGHLAGTLRSIEEHCRDEHGWMLSKG